VRFAVTWRDVEPQPGMRNWAFDDALITDIAAAGLKPSPLIFGVPGWVSPHPARPPIYTAAQRDAWSRFLTDFAARYGQGGAFWRQHPELPYVPLTDWEVWNEPNLNGFWDGQPSPRRYLSLLELTRDGLRGGDPAARIVVGGIFPHPRPKYGVSVESFLNRLYRANGARAAFDAVALHPYSMKPKEVLETCREVRKLMAKHHDRGTPLWITELGWTTSGARWASSPFRASEAKQAQNLRRSIKLLIRARRGLRLEEILWHAWRDYDGPGNDPWTFRMGLLRSDGTAKPAWNAFMGIAHG
jgi:hypothetical protein